jgi:hypothetical protein
LSTFSRLNFSSLTNLTLFFLSWDVVTDVAVAVAVAVTIAVVESKSQAIFFSSLTLVFQKNVVRLSLSPYYSLLWSFVILYDATLPKRKIN